MAASQMPTCVVMSHARCSHNTIDFQWLGAGDVVKTALQLGHICDVCSGSGFIEKKQNWICHRFFATLSSHPLFYIFTSLFGDECAVAIQLKNYRQDSNALGQNSRGIHTV
jgi:hypothetical protein